ncbi:MAG: hypothetical protein R3358_11980 [Woeseiaceae bacterium]|nr:hypothetical protein [Woeseiaceae bacterium]
MITLAPAAAAQAGEWSAVINGRSMHLGASESWNENNLGLGVEYQFATETRWKTLLMVNGLRDSADKMSYMAGAGLHRNLFQTDGLADFYVDVGVNAFLMTRHDVNDNRPFPGALPSLTVGNRYGGFNLTYLPRKAVEKLYSARMADEGVSGIIYLQFKLSATALGFGGD